MSHVGANPFDVVWWIEYSAVGAQRTLNACAAGSVNAMPRDSTLTRFQIVAAADELFYGQGFHAVSMMSIAEKAGVTKKTLYYHFRSKDDLFAAYLEARDRPTLDHFQRWAGDSGTVVQRLECIFLKLGRFAGQRSWRGCGFVRAVSELAGTPGHPAVEVARRHKAGLERWLTETLIAEGHSESEVLARALIVLIDGVVTETLLHRTPLYADAALRAARILLAGSPEDQSGRRPSDDLAGC